MLKYFIRALLSLALVRPAYAHSVWSESPTVIVQSLTKIIPRLNSAFDELRVGDLAVFDLDNTVFREAQTLGTDEWYAYAHHKLVSRGLSAREAGAKLELINNKIKTESRMRLMEPGLPDLIRRLQSRGIFVIGLTARHPALADTTIEHLAELNIHFVRSRFPDESLRDFRIPGGDHEFLFRAGVAFTDGSPKGAVLRALIERTGVRPKRVIALDDRVHHVHNIVEVLLELGLEGRVIHYLRVREEPAFDPRVAEMQFRVFRRLGRLISDEEVRRRLSVSCADQLADSD